MTNPTHDATIRQDVHMPLIIKQNNKLDSGIFGNSLDSVSPTDSRLRSIALETDVNVLTHIK